jgi:hypothetical protein
VAKGSCPAANLFAYSACGQQNSSFLTDRRRGRGLADFGFFCILFLKKEITWGTISNEELISGKQKEEDFLDVCA